jgi:hypothetical protein
MDFWVFNLQAGLLDVYFFHIFKLLLADETFIPALAFEEDDEGFEYLLIEIWYFFSILEVVSTIHPVRTLTHL